MRRILPMSVVVLLTLQTACAHDDATAPQGTPSDAAAQLAQASIVTSGIAFARGGDIFVIGPDGSSSVNLTNHPALDRHPSWSSDGRQIAFSSHRDGNAEIYVMAADGSAVTRLTNDPEVDEEPSWSPDGQHIAFATNRDGSGGIYVMATDGSALTRLTVGGRQPSWSPDGQHIAFLRGADIFVMNADGSAQTRLTTNPGWDGDPSWSPDGRQIAFASVREGHNTDEIYVMGADGSAPTRLTNQFGYDILPSWSPDGQHIAFTTFRDGDAAIYVMAADGSAPTRVTMGGDPSWGPPVLDGTPSDTIPPPMPGHPVQVTLVGTDSSGARYDVSWMASVDEPSGQPVGLYRLAYGFNDDSWTGTDSAPSTSAQLRFPLHGSGQAATGWVCVRAEDAAGNQSADQACTGLTVPARDTIPPPMPGHPVQVALVGADTWGATYDVSWLASVDEPSGQPVGLYRLAYGFNDGSWTGTASATSTRAKIRFPLHGSGQAAAGWVCVRAEDAAGNHSVEQACTGLTVPGATTSD